MRKQWTDVLQKEIFDPLGMKDSTDMAAGIEAAPNHAEGYRYDPAGSVEAPFTPIFPYALEGAGAINSNVEDMVHWLRLQLGNGAFDGKKIVSPENLAATRIAKVGISDHVAYALGWLIQQTPNGAIFWHNGGTPAFGAMVAFQPDRKVGVVILSNETLVGMPDSVGLWVLDRIMDNPVVDYAATSLGHAKAEAASSAKVFERPANAQPSPPLAPLYGSFANPRIGQSRCSRRQRRQRDRIDGHRRETPPGWLGRKHLHGEPGSAKEGSPTSPPTSVRCRWASHSFWSTRTASRT